MNPAFRCFTAADADDAMLILKDENSFLPDFIFLDLNLSGIDGKTFLKELKEDSQLKEIPVIIYTTSFSMDKAECMMLGASAFITKPLRIADIRDAIWRAVSHAHVSLKNRLKNNKIL